MKVALVSDSHGSTDRLEILMQNLNRCGIRYLIHAGDFASYDVELIFGKYPEMEIYIARGNCDVNEEVLAEIDKLPNCHINEVVRFTIEKTIFAVSHIEGIAQRIVAKPVDIFCHGHTHRQKIENHDQYLVLNPGALCEDGGFLIIDLPQKKVSRHLYNEDLLI